MEKRDNTIKKNIAWNSVGTFVMFFCQWLMMVLVVRLSGYSDSGILSLSISCGNVFLIIAAFGVKTYQVSDVSGKYQPGHYYGAKILTVILTVIVAVIWVLISPYEFVERSSIILYTLYIMVYSYSDVLYGELQKKWRLDKAGISMCIRNIAALVAFCILIGLTKNIKIALIVMLVVSLIVLFTYDLPQTKKIVDIQPDFAGKTAWKLLGECFPYAIYTFLHTLVLTVPKLAVRGYFDKDTLGIYSAVLAPVTVLQVVATFVINPLSTLLALHLQDGRIKNLVKTMVKCFLMLVGFLIVGILVAIFLGKFGLRILYGEDIVKYSYLLVPMVFISILTALTILLGNLAIVLRDHLGANLSGILGLVVAILVCVLIVPKQCMTGANTAFLLGLATQDIILVIFIIFRLRKRGRTE
ncbi:MAG: lipopolysaccharide biosynthesis protein [Lachnospiraceae bacterium]|nr:lipopolysaccharide biosynthesis protein [Lachnospiraceae bacterium]